jgi:hypothetical protein
MKILAIGDVFGRPGRQAIRELLPRLKKEYDADFVIVNTENAAGGRGLTRKTADELFGSPIDVMSSGNHIFEHDELKPYFETHPIVIPFNVKERTFGKGYYVAEVKGVRVAVVSLQGELFMQEKGPKSYSPFKCIDENYEKIRKESDIIIIDFHAEATSEKRALAWYLDGKVSAVLGTHTHVQTADEEILPNGTAYISDLGMTGPHASVIGLDKDIAIHRFLTGEKKDFEVAKNDVRLEGVVMHIDELSGKALEIKRIKVKF